MQPIQTHRVFFSTTFRLCDNNGYLSTQICNFFKQNGMELVNAPDTADTIVISTCGFDQERENASYSIAGRYIEQYAGDKHLIVCGCLPKINPGLFDLSTVTLIGPKELYRFNELFSPVVPIEAVSGSCLDENFINRDYGFLDAYYLQICQGCVNHCSYCAIKKAKGHVTSKPLHRITKEIEHAMDSGFKTIMLLADDCASYGIDIGIDLADLLNGLKAYDVGLHLNYVEPGGFLRLLPKIDLAVFEKIRFINIPVQATSKRILERMNRHYNVDHVGERIKAIKQQFPTTYFETHVIYGFPGENRLEFMDTFRLTQYFDSVIYFYYTDRKNVPSSSLPDKTGCREMIWRTRQIMSHDLFSGTHDTEKQPLVLLGYGLDAQALFKSIESSCPCHDQCLTNV